MHTFYPNINQFWYCFAWKLQIQYTMHLVVCSFPLYVHCSLYDFMIFSLDPSSQFLHLYSLATSLAFYNWNVSSGASANTGSPWLTFSNCLKLQRYWKSRLTTCAWRYSHWSISGVKDQNLGSCLPILMTSEAFRLPTSSYHWSPIYAVLSTLPCSMASNPRIMALLDLLQKISVAWTHLCKCQQDLFTQLSSLPFLYTNLSHFAPNVTPGTSASPVNASCLWLSSLPLHCCIKAKGPMKIQEMPVQLAFICPASLPLLWFNLSSPWCLCCLLFRATFYSEYFLSTILQILGMLCLLESFKCSSKGFPKTGQYSKGKTDSNGLSGAYCGS